MIIGTSTLCVAVYVIVLRDPSIYPNILSVHNVFMIHITCRMIDTLNLSKKFIRTQILYFKCVWLCMMRSSLIAVGTLQIIQSLLIMS